MPHPSPPVRLASRSHQRATRDERVSLTRPYALLLALAIAASGCQGVPNALGPDARSARENANGLFAGLAARFDNVVRAPKFQQGRAKLGRHALSPSKVIGDTSVWTSSAPDSSRTLQLSGTHTPSGYVFTPRSSVPVPSRVGDSRHVIRLRRRGESEYEWNTSVDHAIGSIGATDVAAGITAFFAAPEQRNGGFVRARHQTLFPRSTRVLGELFSLDTVRVAPMPDGSSSVVVQFRMHPRRIEKTRPNFAKYLDKYVEPARYGLSIRDGRGATWFTASGSENRFTISYRSHEGRLLALAGPPRPMPDTAQIAFDFSAKFMIFRVGVSRLVGDFITVRDARERGWIARFRREPEWHFPLAVSHFIRSSLRYPFSGDGIFVRVTLWGGENMRGAIYSIAPLRHLALRPPGLATHAVIGTLRPTDRRRATSRWRNLCRMLRGVLWS